MDHLSSNKFFLIKKKQISKAQDVIMGCPWWLSSKELTCNAGDMVSGSGRSPGRNGNPLQYSCLENSVDRRAWRATVYGVAKSQTRLSNSTISDHTCRDNLYLCKKSGKTLGSSRRKCGSHHLGFLTGVCPWALLFLEDASGAHN